MSKTPRVRFVENISHEWVAAKPTPARPAFFTFVLCQLRIAPPPEGKLRDLAGSGVRLLTIAMAWLVMSSDVSLTEAAQDVTRSGALDQFIEIIEDEQMREELLEHLRMSAEVPGASATGSEFLSNDLPEQPSVVEVLAHWASEVMMQLPTMTFGVPIDEKVTDAVGQLGIRLRAGLSGGQLIGFLAWAVPALLFVVCGCMLIRRVGQRTVAPAVPKRKRWLAAALTLRGMAYVALFCAVAVAANRLSPTATGAQVFTTLTVGIIVSMLGTDFAISGLSLATAWRGVRLVHYCQSRFRGWFLAVSLSATFAALARDPSLGRVISWSAADVASFGLNLLAAFMVLIFTLRYKSAVDRLLLRTPSRSRPLSNSLHHATLSLARHWQLLACAFLALSVIGLVGGQRDNDVLSQMLWSFGTALAGFTCISLLNRTLKRRTLSRRASNAVRQTVANAILRVLRFASNGLIALAVAIILARIWGFDLGRWLVTEGLPVTGPILAGTAVLAVAWLIWVALDSWISSALTAHSSDWSGRRSGRLQTLLPLIRNGIMIVLVVLAGIAVLANVGVDVTPLIAGAGVFGLALSFGSQQLVQDLITGVFILAEDTISIGDTINTGDRTGVVENISLRTIRLRDADGSLHSVPFSTIKALKNSSRNYGVLRPRYTVPTGISADQVLEQMRATAKNLRSDPKFSGALMSDLLDVGVDEINAGSVTVSGSLRTSPLRQAEIARAFNGGLLQGLSARGIAL